MTDEELTELISLRMTKADRDALHALAAKLPLRATAIARIALRLGMQRIADDPSAIFEGAKAPKRRK